MNLRSIVIYILSGVIGLSVMPIMASFITYAELFNFDFSGIRPVDRFILAILTVICFVVSILVASHQTGETK